MSRPDILIYAPSVTGGLAEHVYYQARALHQSGTRIRCLASRHFVGGRACDFPIDRRLAVPPPTGGNALRRRLGHLVTTLVNQLRLAWWVATLRPRLVLLDSYAEYFSPLWVWPHAALVMLLRVRYVANLHDPVRNYRLGPAWWHALSVRLAYLPLDTVLVHDKLPEPSPVPPDVRVIQVPVGVYDLQAASRSRDAVRQAWGAEPTQRVFLSFGYVRNGKNLDLAIRALPELKDVFLVIAGSIASAAERPYSYYRELATELGVADRVRFHEGFVSDADLADYFAGTDFILLTYSAKFHSQSGVLNLAARARKSVLASAAPSPLLAAVRAYALGVAIEPDSAPAVVDGMRRLLSSPPAARWDDYHRQASWETNARGILQLLPSSP